MRWYPRDHWRKWYAWYPIITDHGVVAWLETVWRRHDGVRHHYLLREEYSDIEPPV
jgi:hypothetical protein